MPTMLRTGRISLLAAIGSGAWLAPLALPAWRQQQEAAACRQLGRLSPESVSRSCGAPVVAEQETISGGGESAEFETICYRDWSAAFSNADVGGRMGFERMVEQGKAVEGGRNILEAAPCLR